MLASKYVRIVGECTPRPVGKPKITFKFHVRCLDEIADSVTGLEKAGSQLIVQPLRSGLLLPTVCSV